MKKIKGMPITGAKPRTSMKRPFVPDAKETSADAQTMIAEAPTPFKNRMTTAQMPAGSQAPPTPAARGAMPSKGAIGQNRPINQSGQVFGAKGVSHPSRKGAFFAGGFATHRGASDAGGHPSMRGASTTQLTNPMAGQVGRRMGGSIDTSATATKKPNRKGGSAFYGEV